MYINNKYLEPTTKSRSIYHILKSQNCEMSFTSFSIENSIPNVKHFKKKVQKENKKRNYMVSFVRDSTVPWKAL